MQSLFPQLSPSSLPHVHLADEVCPYCEQPIPNEKAEQVRARWEAKERELSEALTQTFALEKVQIEASANARVDQVRCEGAAALEKLKSETVSRETTAREEGKKAAEATSQVQIANLQERLGEAERVKQEAVTREEALKATQEAEIQQRVQEVREALEAANMKSLNAQAATHFEETQKLKSTVADLTRQLDKKTANELGEGAEIDLFEMLKGEFEGDHIRRVGKGKPGADIIHEIIHNNKVCGKIVYDSKNRKAWLDDYVTKLRADQLAEQAEHAVLSVLKFKRGHSQLCILDGVIVVNPARVRELVQLLRRQIVLVHSMRLSNDARAQKTDELYEFIRSGHCLHLFERIDSQAENLLDLQEKEKKAHDKMWNQQGTLLRGIQKARGELTSEIERIIGTGTEGG